MGSKWDYRTVEGALYRLSDYSSARPSQSSLETPTRHMPASRPPSAEYQDRRIDIGIAAQQALDADEIEDVREHYILGIKRHGYKRRASIVKKLVSTLNTAAE